MGGGGVEIDCPYLTSEASTGYIFCLRCSPYLFSFHEFPNANGVSYVAFHQRVLFLVLRLWQIRLNKWGLC